MQAALLIVFMALMAFILLLNAQKRVSFGPKKTSRECIRSFQQDECRRQPQCVFISSPGRSGSTALQDALNQMDGVYVRGENFHLLRFLFSIQNQAFRLGHHVEALNASEQLTAYQEYVSTPAKPAWYNNFSRDGILCATWTYFRHLFGHGGLENYVVGFKSIRLWNVTTLIAPGESLSMMSPVKDLVSGTGGYLKNNYDDFELYMDFYLNLCDSTKIIFNHRKQYNYSVGHGFFEGEKRGQKLKTIVDYAEKYAATHPNDTMIVYFEDMFDASKNVSLMNDLGNFMNKPVHDISFARLPKW